MPVNHTAESADGRARWILVVLVLAIACIAGSVVFVVPYMSPRPAQAIQAPEPPKGVAALATSAALDTARLLVDTRQQMVNGGKERLRALEEVRPIDLEVLATQVKEAEADVVRTRAEYDAATIRSPIDGRVMKVYAWP